jgi:16S rRNA (guanine966-N2)-methyltransferase
MTRVIAGAFKGRRLEVPEEGVRPTSDKVREALFSAIESRRDLGGARVLDLFAGTGALGIEALSRGATLAVFIESNRAAVRTLTKNLESLSLIGQARVVVAKAREFLAAQTNAARTNIAPTNTAQTNTDRDAFDLVLLDPPYEIDNAEVDELLTTLVTHGWLAPGATVALERPTKSVAPTWPERIDHESHRTYGDTTVWYGEMCR